MSSYEIIETPNIKRPSDCATTVSFHKRRPGGVKVSKVLSENLCNKYGVTRSALKVQIKILNSPHLDTNNQLLSAVDRNLRQHTSPWGDDGRRVLPNTLAFKVDEWVAMIEKADIEFEKHIEDLPRMKAVFDALPKEMTEGIWFPTPESERAKYRVSIDRDVIPDWESYNIGGLEGDEKDKFIADIRDSEQRRMQGVVKDAAQRTVDVIEKATEKMDAYGEGIDGKMKGVFRDTLISNIKSLADLLKHLNVTEDPRLERVRKLIIDKLCATDAETLRDDPEARAKFSKDAKKILAEDVLRRMGDFGSDG